ncbi:MAG: glycosyltransferase family 4 protein [Hyphomicrobiaceae bacterium]
MSDMRVMVIQQGARRNYTYARQLEAAGLLHSVVTDAAWPESGPGLAGRLAIGLVPRLSRTLGRRTVHGVPGVRLRASALPNLASLSRRIVHEERAYAIADEALALANRWRGLDGASIVVNYQGNGGSFLDYAKRKGAKIVTDFIITPKYLEIERDEQARWPEWEAHVTPQAVIDFYRRRVSHLVQISDVYLCPSQAVVRDLAELPGFVADRVRVLPYGVSGMALHQGVPVPGRVLFAGAAGLRKGLPYLANAATVLKRVRPDVQIVVAGQVADTVRERPEVRDLTFLGVLDRQQMADEFARADVFCLPSLAEGSATSIFEALANGLPVVTTASSGSVVTDGVEGFIVPERDGERIAKAILAIVSDRAKRMSMSQAASATAQRYGDDACGEAFVAAIKDLDGRGA